MKLAIVGSRQKVTAKNVFLALDKFRLNKKIDLIISGGAPGVDTFAARWAQKNQIKLKVFRPDWKKFGRSAGAIRNQQIIDECDEVAIFWNGESKGTMITFKMAQKKQKPIYLFFAGAELLEMWQRGLTL